MIKLWVAMLFFAWMGSTASALFKKAGWTSPDPDNMETFEITVVGVQAYWPETLPGWGWTLLVGGALRAPGMPSCATTNRLKNSPSFKETQTKLNTIAIAVDADVSFSADNTYSIKGH